MTRNAGSSSAWLIILLCVLLAGQASAHELQPGSLELRQLTSERFEIIWRAPVYYK